MEKYAHPVIDSIMKDPQNRICFDCSASLPKWASINNGVFVCLNCAGVHRGLGVNISFIRSLTMDNWDEKQLKFLCAGGNRKLREVLDEYNIPLNTDNDLKYKLKAVEYHRAIVLGENYPEKPDIVSGLESMTNAVNSQKSFDNINFISSETLKKESIPEKKKNTLFGKVGTFFQKTADDLGNKLKEMKIPEKFDKTTEYLDKKTKDVMQTKLVKNVVDKAKSVFTKKKGDTQSEENIREIRNIKEEQNILSYNDPIYNKYETHNQQIPNQNQNIDNFFFNSDSKVNSVSDSHHHSHNIDLINYNINHIDMNSHNDSNLNSSPGLVEYPSFEDITSNQPKNTNNSTQNINSFFNSK